MSVEPISDRYPDRSSNIPTQVRKFQSQACVGNTDRRVMIENIRTHPYTRAVYPRTCDQQFRQKEMSTSAGSCSAAQLADAGRPDLELAESPPTSRARVRAARVVNAAPSVGAAEIGGVDD